MDCGADSADAQGKQGHIAQLLDITGAWKRHSAECLRKITPAKIFQRRGSLSSINIDGETPKSRRDRLPPAGNYDSFILGFTFMMDNVGRRWICSELDTYEQRLKRYFVMGYTGYTPCIGTGVKRINLLLDRYLERVLW